MPDDPAELRNLLQGVIARGCVTQIKTVYLGPGIVDITMLSSCGAAVALQSDRQIVRPAFALVRHEIREGL